MTGSGCLVFMLWDISQQRELEAKKKQKKNENYFLFLLQFFFLIYLAVSPLNPCSSSLCHEYYFFFWYQGKDARAAESPRSISTRVARGAGRVKQSTRSATPINIQHLLALESNISPFYLAIIVLNAVKYLIIGLTARERPVAMATVKAIGFLFSGIMNFSPPCVTLPLHSQPLRLNWSPRVLEIPRRLCLIICQTREKHRGKKKMFKAQQMHHFRPRGVGVSHNQYTVQGYISFWHFLTGILALSDECFCTCSYI